MCKAAEFHEQDVSKRQSFRWSMKWGQHGVGGEGSWAEVWAFLYLHPRRALSRVEVAHVCSWQPC